MPIYIAKNAIKHSGNLFAKDAEVSGLDEKSIERLLKIGAIEAVGKLSKAEIAAEAAAKADADAKAKTDADAKATEEKAAAEAAAKAAAKTKTDKA